MVVVFLLLVAVVGPRPEQLTPGRLIHSSIAWSVILLVALVSTW